MPANKHKAQQFIDSVTQHASKERERLNLEHADIDLRIGVKVEDRLTYDAHEDED